jgi:hypothetical protein
MLTAMLTVENILDGTDHDVWEVNVEEEYHEEDSRPATTAGAASGVGVAAAPGANGAAAQAGANGSGAVNGSGPAGRPGTGRDAPVLPSRR